MSTAMSQGKMITYAKEVIVEEISALYHLTDVANEYNPGSSAEMQRSNGLYWKPVEQRSVTHDGWTIADIDTQGVLELSIQGSLGEPTSTFRQLRADDVKDETSFKNAVRADAKRLKGKIEADGLGLAVTNGSYVQTHTGAIGASGQDSVWDALSKVSSNFVENEFAGDMLCGFLKPSTYRAGGQDLIVATNNQLPSGEAYTSGSIGKEVAGFKQVFQHAKVPTLTAATGGALAINDAAIDIVPLASQSVNGIEVPFDNRYATLAVDAGTIANVKAGDKFTIPNVNACSLDEKTDLGYLQTFTVTDTDVGGNTITFSPRPISVDNASLTDLQEAHSNCIEEPANDAVLTWLNIANTQTSVVMTKDSMVLASTDIPLDHELFQDLNAHTFQAGPIRGMVGFQSSLNTLVGGMRIALWYKWNIEKPQEIGVILEGQT